MYKMYLQFSFTFVARVLLAIYLFGIGVTAAQACVSLTATPIAAFAQSEMPSCHQNHSPNKNACLMHCIQSDQTTNSQSPLLTEGAKNTIAPIAILPFLYVADYSHQAQPAKVLAINTGPPLPILFCRFLN